MTSETTAETTATLLASYLRQTAVAHVFGYPGESVVDFMEATRHGGPAVAPRWAEARIEPAQYAAQF